MAPLVQVCLAAFLAQGSSLSSHRVLATYILMPEAQSVPNRAHRDEGGHEGIDDDAVAGFD